MTGPALLAVALSIVALSVAITAVVVLLRGRWERGQDRDSGPGSATESRSGNPDRPA